MSQARFEFRLEALLTRRKQIEREHQLKVAQIQQQIQVLMRQIQDAQSRIVEENGRLSVKELVGHLDMQYIARQKRYVGNLHVQIILTMQRMAAIEKTLTTARAELLEAARSRKVIEKLREKQFARWLAELERQQAAQNDEIGTQLAIRQVAELPVR